MDASKSGNGRRVVERRQWFDRRRSVPEQVSNFRYNYQTDHEQNHSGHRLKHLTVRFCLGAFRHGVFST